MSNSTEQQKQKCAAVNAGLGSIGRKKRFPIEEGQIWKTNQCGHITIIKYTNTHDITVRFENTGTERSARSASIRSGGVMDYNAPTIYGVGYLGYGNYKARANGKITPQYGCWFNMLTRCYNDKYISKKPTYAQCFVVREWHNFQVFAKWYDENCPLSKEDYHLDKDYTVIGNKKYSPETCVFIPASVNSFMTDNQACRGNLNIGVMIRKDSGAIRAECSDPFGMGRDYLGQYPSEELAHVAWRRRKSQYCDELISKYESEKVKRAISNYKYALDNNLIYKV